MSISYKHVVVVGATSGIGQALAERFIQNGAKVVVVGRRQEALDSFVKKHGRDKASAVRFDISELDKIPEFAKSLFESHPAIDAVLLNSGVQRPTKLAKPASIDLKALDFETTVNYISYVHLVTAILPYLQEHKGKTALMGVTSGLALVPMPLCANYCATKAALHHYWMSLRAALDGSNVKVIEIIPPAVHTELHNEKNQPEFSGPRDIGMALDDFINQTWEKLVAGDQEIPIGFSQTAYDAFESKRQEFFKGMLVGDVNPAVKSMMDASK